GQHPLQQPLRVSLLRADGGPHRTALAQVPGERPGAADRDAGDPLRPQLVAQAPHGPPARRDPGGLPDDVAAYPDPAGLGVVIVDAGVANVRGSHRDDLAAVGRVGESLLVSGHAGVEDQLAEGLAGRAVAGAVERQAVFEHQHRRAPGRPGTWRRPAVRHRGCLPHCLPRRGCPGHGGHLASFPSRTVGLPRKNVATTRPGRTIPANGVLRLLEACADGSTTSRGEGSYRTRLAGAPGCALPCPASRPIAAGRAHIRSATPAQSSNPVSTIASWTTRIAVSRPVMPNAAADHSVSLSSSGCGA